jgi:hypothetical protein
MIQTFTPNDLLKANSGELTNHESRLLESAVIQDEKLSSFRETLQILEDEIPGLITDPGEKLTQSIMSRIRLEMSKKPA